MMKKLISCSASVLLYCTALLAQGIDANVQVTNQYKSEASDFTKLGVMLSVPDSLMRFDYDFDYSVFDSPYKGAYEFQPYNVKMVPEGIEPDSRRFYLHAGAGYDLHPVLKAVYNPIQSKKSSLTIYQDLRGYAGRYWQVGTDMKLLAAPPVSGRDLAENFGVEGKLETVTHRFDWNVDYKGYYNKDIRLVSNFHSLKADARLRNITEDPGQTRYDFDFSVRASEDIMNHEFSPVSVLQHSYAIIGTIQPCINRDFDFFVDVNTRLDSYGGALDGVNFQIEALPRMYYLLWDKVNLDAGLKLGYVTAAHKFCISPQLVLSLPAANGSLNFNAGIKGGQFMNSYADYKDANHRFNIQYLDNFKTASSEKVNLYAGVDGRLGDAFNYSLRAGYGVYDDMAVLSVEPKSSWPDYAIVDYNLFYADAALGWKCERFSFDADASLRKSSIGPDTEAVDFPLFSGNASAVYNWYERLYLGVSARFSSERRFSTWTASEHVITPVSLSAFCDLSACIEYKFREHLSLWVKGGNLLNSTVQLSPLYVEYGIHAVTGVSMSF